MSRLAISTTLLLLCCILSTGLGGCATSAALNSRSTPRIIMESDDDGRFPFSRDEVYQALRLVESEIEARQHADEIAKDMADDMDWAMSDEMLLVLSLVSDAARAKADRLHAEVFAGTKQTWLQEQMVRTGLPAAALEGRWQEELDREQRAWSARREEVRRKLLP